MQVSLAIFKGNFKFINSTAGKKELYDLSKDPNERKNIYNLENSVSKELETKLNSWLSTIKSADAEGIAPVKLDRDTLDALKTLGYVK